jgi:uncharacterized protein
VFPAVAKPPVRQPSIEAKVEFLSQAGAYPGCQGDVVRRETHMSWVFLTSDRAYKLKKPVRFPYLDFSTLARREAACRAEITLNRRLAPEVYLGVTPLMVSDAGLAIDGSGDIADWLVVMRRLDDNPMLDRTLVERRLQPWQIDRLVVTLAHFYRRATPVFVSPRGHLVSWHGNLLYNRRVLLDPRLGMPAGLVRRIDRVQRLFLARRGALLADRVRSRRIVDAHGDLRSPRTPEKWPKMARAYLGLALTDAVRLERSLRTRGGRKVRGRHGGGR